MPDLIILRLVPAKQVDPNAFKAVLSDLTITAYDLSFEHTTDPVKLGSAAKLADPHLSSPPDNTVDIAKTKVLQHYIDITKNGSTTRHLQSAATAVIVVKQLAEDPEYPTATAFDLKLELKKSNGETIGHHRLHYNIVVSSMTQLSKDQSKYFDLPTSAFVTLPASNVGLDPHLAFVDLPPNGQAPSFLQLTTAIDRVLAKDPGGGATLLTKAPLTPAQSRQVANEIAWNRTAFPQPLPELPLFGTGSATIGLLYSPLPGGFPPEFGIDEDKLEKARTRFEAELNGYYGTHEAEALRLAGFVYTASAAIVEERASIGADRAALDFPLLTGAATPTTAPAASVILTRAGGLTPSFVVPAAYFYALAAQVPTQVDPAQRFDMARFATEKQLLTVIDTAVDDGVIAVPAKPSTVADGDPVNQAQMARRLHALGAAAGTLTEVPLADPLDKLVTRWLAHPGRTATIDTDFWQPDTGAHREEYLRLVLEAITAHTANLVTEIETVLLEAKTVERLVAVTDKQWRTFFTTRSTLLPPYTAPGTTVERTEVFIRHLRRFFEVRSARDGQTGPDTGAPPELTRSGADVLAAFASAYSARSGGAEFTFSADPDPAVVTAAIDEVLPDDPAAQRWLAFALTAIRQLWVVTDIGKGELRFSLLEALYARGFTAAAQIAALSRVDFRYALSGSVAYDYSSAIYDKATEVEPFPPDSPGSFAPVNPGSLVDCVPPEHLSPLGPVAYLHQMLQVSAESSCAQPQDPGSTTTLAALVAARRGPIGELHATKADLATRIPVLDMVNESLESLVTTTPTTTSGVVYDTAATELAGHRLSVDGTVGGDPYLHDPDVLFAALPQHSSPACPVAKPGAYDLLRTDFTHPQLPYAQALDVNRAHLRATGSNRFAVLRRFRRDITEFAIDAAHEPEAFRTHLWRYPLRLPVALEYLGISPEESDLLYRADIADEPTPGHLTLREVYGFPESSVGELNWQDVVTVVPEFLRRTGLDYCEFLQLWRSGFVPFGPGDGSAAAIEGEDPGYPECLPCCPEDLTIDFGDHGRADSLRRLAVFIRLWRRLRENPVTALSFDELADICTVLGLFQGGSINPDFLRQLCALLVLRELLCLPLTDAEATDPQANGARRTCLLALWVGTADEHWDWALRTLIDGIEDAAERARPELGRQPELAKLMAQNMTALSRLAGFDPDVRTDTWHFQPTSTLRFAEVLVKIYLSEFTVGEILFLFADDHLDGDDPFPLPTPNESADDPLSLPDDTGGNDLWALRARLLEASGEATDSWTWTRITAALTDEFGYLPIIPVDALRAVGERFFPSVLEREGIAVAVERRRFTAALAAANTTPAMWNAEPAGPLHYDIATPALWTQLPLDDAALAERLSTLRPLHAQERAAVSELYFRPRAVLVPFAPLFTSFEAAVHFLVHEPDEQARFEYFRTEFAVFHRRCLLIAEHLTAHVRAAAPQPDPVVGAAEVARLLRSLHGDENAGVSAWEDDSGRPPALTWPTAPTGGAYAALLGLVGTGLPGEFAVAGTDPSWREQSGPLSWFDPGRNEWNAPVPTVIPAMDLTLTVEQLRLVAVRNGFAMGDEDGEPLFGAQPFRVTWAGTLLVEHGGRYEFAAGEPTPEEVEPDCDHCDDLRWRVTLRRGQRSWILLNRGWPGEDAPDCHSAPIELRRGGYEIVVEFNQPEPLFDTAERVRMRHTGFQVKYTGPDTDARLVAVPHERLYRNAVDETLDSCLHLEGAAAEYLRGRYTSSLRDIRRTYQRAFKSTLLAHRLRLSAATLPREPQSELGYLLDHAESFAGQTYPRIDQTTFGTHRAWFDLDLLPVTDPYHRPHNDQRAEVSARRQAALFDCWERLFDYTGLRTETRAARERPAWRVFLEAAERQPDDPAQLVRHLGVDVRHAPAVLTYFVPGDDYHIATSDLESEAWPIRVWQGEKWLDRLEQQFRVARIEDAKPARWAADRPERGPDAGNTSLIRFIQDGCFENGDPRRYLDVQALDDGLRVRARDALVAWLCGMKRVPLSFVPGRFATSARDLTDLLLQDVSTGTGERVSRIEDAISAVHAFVQRARLGLEPSLAVSPELALLWEQRFASFRTWQCAAEREVYRENWIEWDELAKARRVEAFTFLEAELRRRRLTVAVPGGTEWWPGQRPPTHPGLTPLQTAELSRISVLVPHHAPTTESGAAGPSAAGLNLLGEAAADARPSWRASVVRELLAGNGNGDHDDVATGQGQRTATGRSVRARTTKPGRAAKATSAAKSAGAAKAAQVVDAGGAESARGGVVARELTGDAPQRLPVWLSAAVRLGARFVRLAAAGIPPASAGFAVCEHDSTHCGTCGQRAAELVDEYYFWLEPGLIYAAVPQDADIRLQDPDNGAQVARVAPGGPDDISDWHREDKLPALLDWQPRSVVHLVWSRHRDGRFDPPRRSSEPIVVRSAESAALVFTGRTGDSLRFQVSGGVIPQGHADTTAPGFRYDLVTDTAVPLPLVGLPPEVIPGREVGGLDAYPFFAYVCPGAPVQPLTLFSVALTVGGALRTDCRFEAALKWYELIRNPSTTDNTWSVCVNTAAADGEPGAELRADRRDVTCCATTVFDDDRARDRSLLLRHLETMLAWADALRSRNNPEAARRAEVVLAEIARILGPRPDAILAQDDSSHRTVARFRARPAPLNPRLLALYDRTADRLTTIRAGLSARRLPAGTPGVDMPYFGDDARRDGWWPTGCGCGGDCCDSCCHAYRFTILVARAQQLAAEVRGLGAQLLAAHEKGDAEFLAALRASQEHQLTELTVRQRQMQWRDADWQVQALGKTKEGAQTRLRYYRNLIADGLNSGETGYVSLTGVSTGSRTAGNVLEAIAQGMGGSPDFWFGAAGTMGSPLSFTQFPVGSKLGSAFATGARIMNALSEVANSGAGLSNTEGGWDRRLADWRQQVDVITVELEQIERQILGAERRRDMALIELNNQQRQLENAVRVQDFLRDKFTSHDLYLYLQQETAAQYFRMYELARCAAGQAERAFNYERGYTTRSFIGADDFDELRAGLLAGERLQLAVARMDKAYLDENCREYELTKHISLRQCFPLAFVQLQTRGYAEIELPEWLFDLDYPGHYLRRIKNVTVTIPCVVGPYTGVHCRLTLLSSQTRVDPRLAVPPQPCCRPGHETGCGCVPLVNSYAATVEDGRVLRAYAATEAIATSSGQSDAGLFELNFRDERYLPFEFAGAVGRWRIELPQETNYFDFESLSDVVLHLNYTAREGGSALRDAAAAAAACRLPGDGLRLFDVRTDLPDAWAGLSAPISGDGPRDRTLDLRLSGAMFPFVPGRRVRWIRSIQLFVEAPGADPNANFVARFRLGRHEHCARHCECGWTDVHFVAAGEYPYRYWGVVDLDGVRLGPVDSDRPESVGSIEFPSTLGEICGAKVVLGYCADPWRCGGGEQCECGRCGREGRC